MCSGTYGIGTLRHVDPSGIVPRSVSQPIGMFTFVSNCESQTDNPIVTYLALLC